MISAGPITRPRVPFSPDRTSRTLLELVDARAATFGEAIAYTDLHDGEEPGASISFAGLARAARSHAVRLADVAAPGSRVLLVMPTAIDFVVAFLGCLYAGLIPVPAPVPTGRTLAAGTTVIAGIARNCGPVAILCNAADIGWLPAALGPDMTSIPVLSLPVRDAEVLAWRSPRVSPDTTAFLQYTSGSTSEPKGVVLTHANLLANLQVIAATTGAEAPWPVVVNWLPLHHDLGLIGGVLGSLFTGGHCLLMPTESFLRRPARWLRAISRFRADVSLAPNFAYDLVARAVRPGTLVQLDLSCWAVAINCAEPVRNATLTRFAAAMAPAGFNPSAFFACYGLAEAALMVTGARRGAGAITNPLVPGSVASGAVPDGVALVTVDPASRRRVPDGQEGEVWVAGASIAAGYWGGQGSEVFGARLEGDPTARRWLRTGDLARILEGQVFITGRLKDVITIAGRQLHPQDIERHVQNGDPRFKLGAGIAFGLERPDGEVLAIAQETTLTNPDRQAEAIALLRTRVFEGFAVNLDTVVLLRPGTIHKTLNGKLQRRACRAAFERGELAGLATSSGVASPS